MLERVTEINILLDFYAALLTSKQRFALEMYYSEDLSLSEIAENLEISRQAVHDLLRRSIKLLEDYESKLNLVSRYQKRKRVIAKITKIIKNNEECQHLTTIFIDLLNKIDEQEE